METKSKRLELANELINLIKTVGRKFFENKHGHDSRLFINDKGNIYFIDDYTGKQICIRGRWIMSRAFSHGGGLNEFIRALANYVRDGKTVNKEWLGQHWGYGEDIHVIRKKALLIGFAI